MLRSKGGPVWEAEIEPVVTVAARLKPGVNSIIGEMVW